jgi:hypothetical protein
MLSTVTDKAAPVSPERKMVDRGRWLTVHYPGGAA